MMRNRQDGNAITVQLVHHGEWKATQYQVPHAIFVDWPGVGRLRQAVDRFERFGAKLPRGHRAAFQVPEKGFADFRLRLRQKNDRKATHKALSRPRASAHGVAADDPSFRDCLRRRTSSRHAFEIEASGLPSRLSSSASTNAARSSVGRSKASASRWSIRAFMRTSLLRVCLAGASSASLGHSVRGSSRFPVHRPSPFTGAATNVSCPAMSRHSLTAPAYPVSSRYPRPTGRPPSSTRTAPSQYTVPVLARASSSWSSNSGASSNVRFPTDSRIAHG